MKSKKILSVAFFSIFIASCGSEDSDEMRLNINPSSIGLHGYPYGVSDSKKVDIDISNANTSIYIKASQSSGEAIGRLMLAWDASYLTIYSANVTTTGTYTERVTIKACTDENCNEQILGSPAYVDVTFTASSI
jgi:hypothetical protein